MREFKSFYAKASGEEGTRCNYPDRLDVYGCGCQHDCAYCYAKSLLDFRKLWNAKDPAVADFKKVAATVKKLQPGSVIRLGGMTDCFMPIEEKHGIALNTVKALNKRGVHQLIVTKSPLIATEKYIAALDPKLSHIQISITSTNDDESAKYEKAARPSLRIEAAETLSKAGFDVSLRVSPYLPQNVDLNVLERVEVPKVLVEFLRVNHWIEQWLPYDTREYTHKEGGYRHLPLRRKKQLIAGIKDCFEEISVCEDVDGHYQFFRAFVNAKHDDCCNLRI